jgi:hypothetical protein
MKNFGIRIRKPSVEDYRFGALNETVVNPSGNWKKYLPVNEHQNLGLETMACVSFSALNCLEILYKFQYGSEVNFSDRFTAKMSGTTKRGNWLTSVGESIRHDGLVLEKDYPSVWTSWNDFYKEVPNEILYKVIKHQVNYEWIIPTNADSLFHALKVAPIQVVVHAWENPVNGIYQKTHKALNHAVTLVNAVYGEYWEVFDSYDKFIKKLSWDYIINHGFRYSIKKINMIQFKKEKNNSAVYLIKGDEAIPIHSEKDFLNLETDWSNVEEVDKIEEIKVNKKLYTFIR